MKRRIKLSRKNRNFLIIPQLRSWRNYFFMSNDKHISTIYHNVNFHNKLSSESLSLRLLSHSGYGDVLYSSNNLNFISCVHRSTGFRSNLVYLDLGRSWSKRLNKSFHKETNRSFIFSNFLSSVGVFNQRLTSAHVCLRFKVLLKKRKKIFTKWTPWLRKGKLRTWRAFFHRTGGLTLSKHYLFPKMLNYFELRGILGRKGLPKKIRKLIKSMSLNKRLFKKAHHISFRKSVSRSTIFKKLLDGGIIFNSALFNNFIIKFFKPKDYKRAIIGRKRNNQGFSSNRFRLLENTPFKGPFKDLVGVKNFKGLGGIKPKYRNSFRGLDHFSKLYLKKEKETTKASLNKDKLINLLSAKLFKGLRLLYKKGSFYKWLNGNKKSIFYNILRIIFSKGVYNPYLVFLLIFLFTRLIILDSSKFSIGSKTNINLKDTRSLSIKKKKQPRLLLFSANLSKFRSTHFKILYNLFKFENTFNSKFYWKSNFRAFKLNSSFFFFIKKLLLSTKFKSNLFRSSLSKSLYNLKWSNFKYFIYKCAYDDNKFYLVKNSSIRRELTSYFRFYKIMSFSDYFFLLQNINIKFISRRFLRRYFKYFIIFSSINERKRNNQGFSYKFGNKSIIKSVLLQNSLSLYFRRLNFFVKDFNKGYYINMERFNKLFFKETSFRFCKNSNFIINAKRVLFLKKKFNVNRVSGVALNKYLVLNKPYFPRKRCFFILKRVWKDSFPFYSAETISSKVSFNINLYFFLHFNKNRCRFNKN